MLRAAIQHPHNWHPLHGKARGLQGLALLPSCSTNYNCSVSDRSAAGALGIQNVRHEEADDAEGRRDLGPEQ